MIFTSSSPPVRLRASVNFCVALEWPTEHIHRMSSIPLSHESHCITMDKSSRITPLKHLLAECKARTSASSGCDNILIRSYLFLCGRKFTFYQGLVFDVLVALETFRQFRGIVFFQQLIAVCAFQGGCFFVVRTYLFYSSKLLFEIALPDLFPLSMF